MGLEPLLLLLVTGAVSPETQVPCLVATVDGREQPSPVEVRVGTPVQVRSCPGSEGEGASQVHWYVLEPLAEDYDNTGPSGVAALRYRWRELPALRDHEQLNLSEVPELAREGTHRIATSRRPLSREIRTPGPETVAGLLDDSDLVIHTHHGVAEERPFGELPYRAHPFDVYRWPAWRRD